MKLYTSKVPTIADDVIRELVRGELIEVESESEARLDVESVLKQYLRTEREVVDEAKNRLEQRGGSYGELGRIKAQVARERGMPSMEDALPFILDQILNILFHSNNVAEVFGDDTQLRTVITPILKRNLAAEDGIDEEGRARIKNLQEGTATFEVEYSKVMADIKRKRGLS
jgi:hypothetical protein